MEGNFFKKIKRYLKIYFKYLKFDFMFDMNYRVSFFIQIAVEVFYTVVAIVFFNVLYSGVKNIVGWTYWEIIFLLGVESIMVELLVGLVFAYGTNNLPSRIKDGEVDFMLMKPINSFISLTIIQPYVTSLFATIPGLYLIFISAPKINLQLTALNIVGALIILVCGFIIAYSVMVMISSLSFVFLNATTFPRIGMNSMTNFATRPHQVFNNVFLRIIFYFVLPSIFIASIPASTLIKGLDFRFLIQAILLAFLFLSLAYRLWNKMIRYYSSASS